MMPEPYIRPITIKQATPIFLRKSRRRDIDQ
jgi:hypothetical protein